MHLKRNFLFGTTVLAGLVAASAPAFAQSTPPSQPEQATTVEEIVVTGSRIRRDPTTAPTPLIQVTGQELLNTGQNTVIDYLATIPALSNSRIPSDTTNTAVDGLGLLGLSTANLRSLGSNRTLTLIDGRRQVGSSQGTLQVDVDTIPRLLIETVEIVTGGASSVYGADAVSGVLNFVLRKDFEGLEIDGNYSQINSEGEANQRISALIGKNLFDDRLNVWGFAEYEKIDEIRVDAVDWFGESWGLVTVDADPAAANFDSTMDLKLYKGLNTISRPRWGQTTLANTEQPSMLSNPLTPYATCNTTSAQGYLSANCYPVDPTKTWVFDGTTARLANFGERVGVGYSRTLMIGGDGDNNATFAQQSRTPENESKRFAVGGSFKITDDIRLSIDGKYIDEYATAEGQPTFYDMFIIDRVAANVVQPQFTYGPSNQTQFQTRTDNAFLPANLRAAILANTLQNYNAPTQNADGTTTGQAVMAAPFARHSAFANPRGQETSRVLQRWTAALDGKFRDVGPIRDIDWGLSYVWGKAEIESTETGDDSQRFALAADSVIDTAGIVNGKPGEIVCRARLIAASGGVAADNYRGGDLRDTAEGRAELAQCAPLNIFGKGNQSQAAIDYTYAEVSYKGINEQEQALASISGQLWDFWGAGSIGLALGAEFRRETTSEIGRDDGNRLLLLNTSADFPEASYDSKEYFAELSIPLIRDSWLGEYAELSGSYRTFDYSTVGTGDVYGINFLYRPIKDIGFKTSFNTSFRAPNLGETYSPLGQTFANGFVDPCATANILAATTAEIKANRIKNCEALAVADGFAPGYFDFAGATATNTDDYVPVYTSGISGVDGGNPFLQPEESESFTFSIVAQPRFLPNLSIVLDYYEIEITNAIATLSAAAMASNCVDGPSLATTCANIFRNVPGVTNPTSPQERSQGFQVGDPATANLPGGPGGFIQGAVNYQGFQTRGMDFTVSYRLDPEAVWGWDIGTFNASLRGSWLIEQKNFTNASNPNAFTELSSNLGYPRVRATASVMWTVNDRLSATWTTDFQSAQDIVRSRDLIAANNMDQRPYEYFTTGNFYRNDLTARYELTDAVTVRAGVTNVFDTKPPTYLRASFIDNLDPYGRRFFVGFNFRPW
jgi:outer membrane receptor protein involved in Fe transport